MLPSKRVKIVLEVLRNLIAGTDDKRQWFAELLINQRYSLETKKPCSRAWPFLLNINGINYLNNTFSWLNQYTQKANNAPAIITVEPKMANN